MNKSRAIEILDPEHREHYDGIDEVNEACRMGMEALRAQLGQTENKPLTLDELREMSLEPVCIVNENMSWWEIVNFISAEYFHGRIGTELPLNNLGVTWLAYRHKPEQEAL